jgi:hypothetical protein
MKKGGIGGANTQTGNLFEEKVDLNNTVKETKDFRIKSTNINDVYEIFYNNESYGFSMKKHSFHYFLNAKMNVNAKNIWSKNLLPDQCFYNTKNKTLYIAEVKWQETPGTADEKPQTCSFKLRQYKRLIENIDDIEDVKYFYIFNDWFKKSCYKDMLEFIIEANCHYFFDDFPLDFIGIGENN